MVLLVRTFFADGSGVGRFLATPADSTRKYLAKTSMISEGGLMISGQTQEKEIEPLGITVDVEIVDGEAGNRCPPASASTSLVHPRIA